MEHAITLQDSLRLHSGVLFRHIDNETVLLHPETGLYFGLDPVGTRIWQLVGEHHSLSRVFEAMLQEYDVSPAQLADDLLALARQLHAKGLIEIQ